MPQTTIRNRMARWLAEGQIATIQRKRIDGALENAYNGNTGLLPFGRVSELNPATKTVTTLSGAPTTGNLLIVPIFTEKYGISLSTLVTRPAEEVGYPADDSTALVEYITEEDVVMYTEEPVNMGQQIHYRHTAAGGNTVLGRVRGSADSTNTATLDGCYFAESVATAGLVAVTITKLVRVS